MKKKTVYIAIELKVREFLSQILLAYDLIKQDYRVYLGSKDEIIELLKYKKNTGGIFLYKAGLHKNLIKIIKKKINLHTVLDQEACPGFPNYMYTNELIPGSFHKETEKTLDLYFTANKKIENIANKRLKNIRGKVVNSGWPRIDLWQKKYEFVYQDLINKLKKKYGNYIIFVSDMGYIDDDYLAQAQEKGPWGANKKQKKKYVKDLPVKAKIVYEEFKLIVNLLKKILKKYKKQKIIIRAHPSENPESWKKIFNKYKNAIIKSPIDDIAPYIMASSGMLHRGCTTSLQAMCANKPLGFIHLKKSEKINQLTFKLSTKISNIEDYNIWKSNINKKVNYLNNKNLIYELNIKKKDSSKIIISNFNQHKCELEEIHEFPQKSKFANISHVYMNLLKRIILKILIGLKLYKKDLNNFGRSPKIYKGIRLNEVKSYLDKFNYKKKFKIKLKQISSNVVLIDKKYE